MEQSVEAPARFSPTSPLGHLLVRHRDEVLAIAKAYGASNVRVFGSTARGDDAAGSDIDLLVDLAPHVALFDLERLQIAISDLLGVKVDVVPASMLKPRVKERVEDDVVLL
jgi:predicted nucleotidyltransferase